MTRFEISYQLKRTHLAAFNRLVSRRIQAHTPWWASPWAIVIALVLTLQILGSSPNWATQALDWGPINDGSFGFGFLSASVLMLLTAMMLMLGNRHNRYRPDGPTMSHHKASIDQAQLEFSAPGSQSILQWPIFTDVTEGNDIAVLWMEPSKGYILPRSAFADDAQVKAFCKFARERIASAHAAVTTPTA